MSGCAEAVQNFEGLQLKMLLSAENYLIGHLQGYDFEVRSAIISCAGRSFCRVSSGAMLAVFCLPDFIHPNLLADRDQFW
jgi:hypothetical protein